MTCCPPGRGCCAPSPAGRTPCACSTCCSKRPRRGAFRWRPLTSITACGGTRPSGTRSSSGHSASAGRSRSLWAGGMWAILPGGRGRPSRRPPAPCDTPFWRNGPRQRAVPTSPPPTTPTTIWKLCCSIWCGGRGSTDWPGFRPGGGSSSGPCWPSPGGRSRRI